MGLPVLQVALLDNGVALLIVHVRLAMHLALPARLVPQFVLPVMAQLSWMELLALLVVHQGNGVAPLIVPAKAALPPVQHVQQVQAPALAVMEPLFLTGHPAW